MSRAPLLVTVDLPGDAMATLMHALDFALRRGSYTAGERASLLRVQQDLELALEPEPHPEDAPGFAEFPAGEFPPAGR